MRGGSGNNVTVGPVEPGPPSSSLTAASRPGHPSPRIARCTGGTGEPPSAAPRLILRSVLASLGHGDSIQCFSSCRASETIQIRCWCLVGPTHSCTGCMHVKGDRYVAPTLNQQHLIKHGPDVPRIQISVDQVSQPLTRCGHQEDRGRLSLPRSPASAQGTPTPRSDTMQASGPCVSTGPQSCCQW